MNILWFQNVYRIIQSSGFFFKREKRFGMGQPKTGVFYNPDRVGMRKM